MKVPVEVEIFDDYEFCEDADNHCEMNKKLIEEMEKLTTVIECEGDEAYNVGKVEGFKKAVALLLPLLVHSVEYGYQYAPNECEECKSIDDILK